MPLYLQASYNNPNQDCRISLSLCCYGLNNGTSKRAICRRGMARLGTRYRRCNCERNYSVHAFHARSSNLVHSFSIESPTYLYAKPTPVSVACLLPGKRTRINDLASRLFSYRTSSHCGLSHISQLSLFRRKL